MLTVHMLVPALGWNYRQSGVHDRTALAFLDLMVVGEER
jgi:hypothetical protein